VGLLGLSYPFHCPLEIPEAGGMISESQCPSGDGKPGICPLDHMRCRGKLPGECAMDHQCVGVKKCCFISCQFRCLHPGEVWGPEKQR
uniref:WAP domain-containing protein n=1 Tax=Vombatus ursinus TaxID=29139 RepID=A0A4X2M8W9_VOMUR